MYYYRHNLNKNEELIIIKHVGITHILIIHYHLKKGGVTDVIKNIINCFDQQTLPLQITLASSDSLEYIENLINSLHVESTPIKARSISSLGYYNNISEKNKYQVSHNEGISFNVKEIHNFFAEYTNQSTLWWVHNHHLGKNPFFTQELMLHLNKTHQPCILHIHDFPEHGRMSNLKQLQTRIPLSKCYSCIENTEFAVINLHDKSILNRGELDAHYIPNIVPFQDTDKKKIHQQKKVQTLLYDINPQYAYDLQKDALLFTYPVRCIRRKNVLESLFIVRMYEIYHNTLCNCNITLPGTSNQEAKYSAMIENLFAEKIVRGFFGIGANPQNTLSLADVCNASDVIVSSSVQEGFGFSYLGAATWQSPLLARYINTVQESVNILKSWPAQWYTSIEIPTRILTHQEIQSLYEIYREKIHQIKQIEGYQAQHISTLENELTILLSSDVIDFAFLSIDIQIRIVRSINTYYNTLLKANKSLLLNIGRLIQQKHTIKHTAIKNVHQSIKEQFSEKAFMHAFSQITHKIKSSAHKKIHDSNAVVNSTYNAYTHISSLRALFNSYE